MEIQLQEDRNRHKHKRRTADLIGAVRHTRGYALQDALCPAQDRGKFSSKRKCVSTEGQIGSLLAAVVIAMIGGASQRESFNFFTEDFNS